MGKHGDGGGDNVSKLPIEGASAQLKPDYVSFRPENGISSVNLDRQTDQIKAANESLDGRNPYASLSTDAASQALKANEAAIQATMDRIAALNMAAAKAAGRGQADDLLGQLEIRNT